MSKEQSNRPELFVDNEAYQWDQDTITGSQIRELAALPDDVQIFHEVPGEPDEIVENETVVDLTLQKRPDRFSTQPVGSQAG